MTSRLSKDELLELTQQLDSITGASQTMDSAISVFLRILPGHTPERTVHSSTHSGKVTLTSHEKNKSQEVSLPNVFDVTCTNSFIYDTILNKTESDSALYWALQGFNTGLVLYGEVDSGKSFTLYGNLQATLFTHTLDQLLAEQTLKIGLSVWELVYSPEEKGEKVVDLLQTARGELATVQVASLKEGEFLFRCACAMSVNWRPTPEGNYKYISNRSHFFVRFTLLNPKTQVVSTLHVVDLAGFETIPKKLSFEEHFTHTGLEQLKNVVWALARGQNGLEATNRSKLIQMLGPLLTDKNYFLGVVREDSEYSAAVQTVELLQMASSITMQCKKHLNIDEFKVSFTHFEAFQSNNKVPLALATPRTESRNSPLTPKSGKAKTIDWVNEFSIKKQQILANASGRTSPLRAKYIDQESSLGSILPEENPKLTHLKSQINEMLSVLDSPVEPTGAQGSQTEPVEDKEKLILQSEFHILKQHYEELLSTHRDEEQLQQHNKLQTEELNCELAELRTTFELSLDDAKLENTALRQKLRAFQAAAEPAEIFEHYESEILRLKNCMAALREKQLDKLDALADSPPSQGLDELTLLHNKMKRTVKELTNQLKGLTTELSQREKEVAEFKRKERKWTMTQKCIESMNKRTNHLKSLVGKQSHSLSSNEGVFHEMIQELESLKTDNAALKRELDESCLDNTRMSQDLIIMRDIAVSSGTPTETIEQLHRNLTTPESKGQFGISLLNKLQKELSFCTSTQKHIHSIENIKHEVGALYDSLSKSSIREKNLHTLLTELQGKLESHSKPDAQHSNRELRATLLDWLHA